ncbi:GNAT family N-acetyltransferase [Zeaxanthinibacter sp. PT1]|uniref:GNAT family N-acetyltransferase n=1 Tax=Zeaxanthinibacter TaxID=561554 RepID=UPI00234B1289|nr:GNAT family N-acetyltransferase [Zeaxanthinibacter sp. PT1]MDC6350447.1 GNAT family N-acetyltransferase [Zeaxanthinibacter sp. PT1]
MQIENSTHADFDEIFRLYREASAYQRSKKTVVVWPDFDPDMVRTEIAENRQWKLLFNGQIACVWATTFTDEQIWEERNADPAVYIHRIAVNPDFRGHNFVQTIVDWAHDYAGEHGKRYIRLDTLGDNQRLIQHYKDCGFDFLGMFTMQDTSGLPDHYHGEKVALFEIELEYMT